MQIKLFSRIALVLGVICCLNACREQGKMAGGGDTIAIPQNFEIDFDGLFDLKQPCVMTPPLLESKVAAMAVIPREKLCKPVKFPQETCHYHWFSAKDAPVHNPGYSIFKSGIHPNFVSVVWQEEAMERFYCVYPAEKDQAVPPELLADMDASLSVAHTFNTVLKQFEWELKHYSVSAKYSTNVGKGDPSFLVNVQNKQVQPKPRILAQQSGGQTLKVNLDDFFDWKKPTSMTAVAFQAKMLNFESTSGRKLRVSDRPPYLTYYFDTALVGANGSFSLLEGRYQAVNAYFQWKEGRISNIRVSLPPMQGGKPFNLSEEVAYLDKFFGMTHSQLEGGTDVWRWSDCQIRCYKYSNSDDYCIELDRHLQFPLAATTRSPDPAAPTEAAAASALPTTASSTPAAAPASANPASNHFKLRLTQMNGLLISQLSSGQEAGQVTKMTLTALPNRGDKESWLEFNQEVGGSMRRCLNEVSKLSQLRHDVWPPGYSLQIGFEDKYIDKDGPSAAVACALLVESAITGKTWDPTFAVTGDLNADGSVQPIGGVRAKIRGATNGSCKLVAVPAKNERSIADIMLLDGPAPLVGITVFGIKTFDDAMLLANSERPQALKNALADFESMRGVMMRDPKQIMPLLRTPHAVARLQALLAAAPGCYSAKYLLLHAQGRTARVLSLGGSIEAAQNSAQAIVSSIDNDVDTAMTRLKPDEVGTSINKLRNLRPLLDQRIWPYVDGITDYGEVIRSAIVNPVRSGARYNDLVSKANQAAGSASAAFRLLMNSSQVREELGL
ncbi:MAG: S16 family serine protease [Prosthecobacter sp.]|uniref:S16 family serine protease n=1 Tax=Prosthecobacter sp. TaxID=1965333 RepID=UPI0039025F1A